MTDEPVTYAHADEHQYGENNIRIHLVGTDCRLLTAVSLAVSIICAFYAFECGRQAAQITYWLQRDEAFLEQLASQGVNVPGDLLPHKDKKT